MLYDLPLLHTFDIKGTEHRGELARVERNHTNGAWCSECMVLFLLEGHCPSPPASALLINSIYVWV